MKTSIVINTYNDENTIFGNVAACCKHNPESEIIVVDDGSTDKTESVLDILAVHHSFEYVKLPRNYGKGYAMVWGAEVAKGDVLVFINGGLTNLRKHHFQHLLSPIYNNEADVVFGAPSGMLIDYNMNPFKSAIGESVMFKDDLNRISDDIREMRYGIEDYIRLFYQLTLKSVKYVNLDGVQYSEKSSESQFRKEPNVNNLEVANLLLTNIDLINKRAQNNIHKTDNYTKSTISSVQYELNNKMLMCCKIIKAVV